MKRAMLFAGLALLAAAFIHCGKDGDSSSKPTPVPTDPSFSTDVQPVFTASCGAASCHSGAGQLGLVLTPNAYANIVNVASVEVPQYWRVRPASIDSSYIVYKIEGRQSVGTRMPPPPNAALGDRQIQIIRNWIVQGAKNN